MLSSQRSMYLYQSTMSAPHYAQMLAPIAICVCIYQEVPGVATEVQNQLGKRSKMTQSTPKVHSVSAERVQAYD